MMASISVRWAGEMFWAAAGNSKGAARSTAVAVANKRSIDVIGGSFSASINLGFGRDDVVRLHPAGAADGEAGFRAGGEVARGARVAAHYRRQRGSEIGLGEVALVAVSHGELRIGVRAFRLLGEGGAQQLHRLLGRLVL